MSSKKIKIKKEKNKLDKKLIKLILQNKSIEDVVTETNSDIITVTEALLNMYSKLTKMKED